MKTSINIIAWVMDFLFKTLVVSAKVIIGFWVIVGAAVLGFLVPAFGIACLIVVFLWMLSR